MTANTAKKIAPAEVMELLKAEKKAFIKMHSVGLSAIKDARNTYLAHPDMRESLEEIGVSFLRDASEWSYAFTNLILHLFAQCGSRAYVTDNCTQLRGFIRDDYNSMFTEMLS